MMNRTTKKLAALGAVVLAVVAAVAEPQLYFATGHSEGINCVAWSRDGKYIASASDDRTIRIWDAATGRELRTLTGHTNDVDYVSWSPDGTMLASISNYGKEAFIWDALTGKITKRIKQDYSGETFAWGATNSQYALIDAYAWLYDGSKWAKIQHPSGTIYSVMYSSDGRYAVTAGFDKTVRVWNVATKAEVAVCKGHTDVVKYACFSPDGKYVVSASSDGTARVWDAFSGKEKLRLKSSSTYVERVSWSPDGRYIATYSTIGPYALRIYTADKGTLVYEQENCGIGLCAESWSPDGKFLVTGGSTIEYFLKIKSTQNWDDRLTLGNNLVNIEQIGLNSDETLIASKAWEESVRVWNVQSGDSAAVVASNRYSGFAWGDSKTIAFGNDYDLYFYDSKSGKSQTDDTSFYGDVLAYSVDGKYLAAADSDEITIYASSTRKPIKTLSCDDSVEALAFSPSGTYLASGDDAGNVRIWKTSNWKLEKNLRMPKKDKYDNGIDALAWSHDSKQLAIGSSDYLMVWSAQTWKQENVSFEDAWQQFAVTWTPDGAYLVSGGTQGKIFIWNPRTGALVRTIQEYGWVQSLAMTRDGKRLFSASRGGTIKAWDFATGSLLYTTLNGADGEWITYTPEGYFTGTDWASQNLVYIVDGLDVIGLDQVYDTFCRPDLIAAKYSGQNVGGVQLPSIAELVRTGDAPVVRFDGVPASSARRDITVSFTVQDKGGGVGNVYLCVNGKVITVAGGTRGFVLDGSAPAERQSTGGKTYSFSHLLSLQNGENVIEAYATNAAGKIESLHAVAKIQWQGATAKPNLYVLTVGVNDYRDRSLRLNYAVPDADAIASLFKGAKGSLYQSVHVVTLLDDQVTASGLSGAFSSLAAQVLPDDVFVFYLSGHGTSYTDGDYYFIPVDFRYRNAESIPQQGISKQFISDNLGKIRAQKTVVLLDTCNSGAFISSGARGMAEKTAIDRLSRATGQATIAASSDDQSAMEGHEGHGVFTYTLLQALSGKADRDGDGYVSLAELSAYVEDEVPALTYELWHYEQYPQIELRKQTNFPLVAR